MPAARREGDRGAGASAEAILAEEYGRPPSEVFAAIEAEPIASASVSQVHAATAHDGRGLAPKIRRPGIEKVVQADLDILKNLSQLAERRVASPPPAEYHRRHPGPTGPPDLAPPN